MQKHERKGSSESRGIGRFATPTHASKVPYVGVAYKLRVSRGDRQTRAAYRSASLGLKKTKEGFRDF